MQAEDSTKDPIKEISSLFKASHESESELTSRSELDVRLTVRRTRRATIGKLKYVKLIGNIPPCNYKMLLIVASNLTICVHKNINTFMVLWSFMDKEVLNSEFS